MAAELAVVVAVFLTVALLATGPTSPARISPEKAWSARALPVVVSLVEDLTNVATWTDGTTASRSGLETAAQDLATDAAAARGLGTPPDVALSRDWSAALARVAAVESSLRSLIGAGSAGGPAAGARAALHILAVSSGDSLLPIDQQLQGVG